MFMLCRSFFVLLYFCFWQLYCLFFDLRILNTPLLYSNSSYILQLIRYYRDCTGFDNTQHGQCLKRCRNCIFTANTWVCPHSESCDQCHQCLWIVHSWLPLPFSLTFICLVSCVPNDASVSGWPFLIVPLVFSNVYSSCVLCTHQPNVSGFFILDFPFSFL